MALKEDILTLLEEHRDTSLSGQYLAEKWNVSRNAIWKAINSLKKEGYAIESTTNKGYRLAESCDRLSQNLICTELQSELPVYVFSSIDSTNEEAKRRIGSESPQFLVASEEQTAGRGRRGRSFFSPKDAGVYMTLVTTPNADADDVVGITSYASVCVVEAIRSIYSVDPSIKWVNDIYLDGKKIGGILTEAISDFETGRVSRLIIGIGINLHPCEVPDELQGTMGFLDAKSGLKNRLVAAIVDRLLQYSDRRNSYMEEYRRYSLVLGKPVRYERNGVINEGVAVALDDAGGLIVQRDDGETQLLRSGEITLRVKE